MKTSKVVARPRQRKTVLRPAGGQWPPWRAPHGPSAWRTRACETCCCRPGTCGVSGDARRAHLKLPGGSVRKPSRATFYTRNSHFKTEKRKADLMGGWEAWHVEQRALLLIINHLTERWQAVRSPCPWRRDTERDARGRRRNEHSAHPRKRARTPLSQLPGVTAAPPPITALASSLRFRE